MQVTRHKKDITSQKVIPWPCVVGNISRAEVCVLFEDKPGGTSKLSSYLLQH